MASSRRGLIKKSFLGGALLAVGGSGLLALRPPRLSHAPRGPLQVFSPREFAICAAVAARVVPGDTADARWPSAETIDCAGKIDALIARTHPEVGRELGQLLRLFDNGLVGLVIAGQTAPFTHLDPSQQNARLEAWSRSRVAVLRAGYQALVRLVHATYFSAPEIHPLLGYPGPPVVPSF